MRLRQSDRSRPGISGSSFEWRLPAHEQAIILRSAAPETPIDESDTLILQSEGWPSEDQAQLAGAAAADALLRALARLRVGVDTGLRAPGGGGFTKVVLDEMWEKHGIRVMNERNGLVVFETDPPPAFSSFSASGIRVIPGEQFSSALAAALSMDRPLPVQERVALDLFNASFFQVSADSRLVLLVMAIEVLLEPGPRPRRPLGHVRLLLALTRWSPFLAESDRQSLLGSLKWLKDESIRQAGIRLVTKRLPDKAYLGKSPKKFFDHCYELRSRLVHGRLPLPQQGETGNAAATLEVMVSDLLTFDLPAVGDVSG
jgi:hypothetical protein